MFLRSKVSDQSFCGHSAPVIVLMAVYDRSLAKTARW
jgi:hypothetical protein